MAFREVYRKQVALLMRILPLIAEDSCFALTRPESLAAIDAAMKRIVARIKNAAPKAQVVMAGSEGAITRLIVREGGVQTKIEVTPVLRGCVYEPEARTVSEAVEAEFGFAKKIRSYPSPIFM
jgi:hypothetical protein